MRSTANGASGASTAKRRVISADRLDEVLGRNLWETFPGARETPLGQLFLDTMVRRQPVRSETPSVVVDGRWLAYRLFPLGDGMGVVFRDVTDRKQAEAQRDLLIKELHHRVNNTLATVQAIAAQTFGNSGLAVSARQAFEARLLNLSNAHTVLTHENWDSVELHDLILSTLRPHGAPNAKRFSIAGPNLRVQPKSAVALSMAIHELGTNAGKYGALSVEGGRVDIAWKVTDARFALRWHEHGGPPVSPPARTGFGIDHDRARPCRAARRRRDDQLRCPRGRLYHRFADKCRAGRPA